jgi:uracil phosphoribosyltransferase
MSNVFISSHPLVAHKLAKLRAVDTEPKKFRELVREIAGLLAYEATADLLTEEVNVRTPLAMAKGQVLREKIGLVLSFGLDEMVEGFWEFMPERKCGTLHLSRRTYAQTH